MMRVPSILEESSKYGKVVRFLDIPNFWNKKKAINILSENMPG